jgi:hypothetical protein
MRKFSLLLAFAALLAFPHAILAQRSTATIRGTVADATRSSLPGALVTAKNDATGLTRTATTNDAGLYSIAELPVGVYTVQVEFAGFKTAVRTGLTLNVADDRAVNFELQPGNVSETVRVEANSQAVRTIGGDVSGVITGEQVRELPLNGRNFLQLVTLMPGVSAPDFLNVKDKGLLGGSDLSVSGSGVTSNLWTVDGANNNDVGSNRTILVYPSVEAIEEFKILRNAYGPEFGQSAGAQISIVTRGGTNQFRGSALYFMRNDSFNAQNYFLKQAGKEKEKLERNDFGGTYGGPIIKDKLHFFASAESNRETRGIVRSAFVPTAAERAGDFSGPAIPNCSSPTPVDPATGEAFENNRIPSDRLSNGGLKFLQLYPLPNTTPAAGSCNNWVASLDTPLNWAQGNVRVDYTMNSSSRLMVRYTQDAWNNNSPTAFGTGLWGDDPFPAVDSNWEQPGRSFVAQLNQTLGDKAVNSLSFSYSGNKITVTRGGLDAALNGEINAAIPSFFPDSQRFYGSDRGHPVFWGGQGYGQALWNEAPFHNNQDLFILKDDYSAVFGKHVIKAGGLVSMNKKNEDVLGFGSAENSQFWGSTGLNGFGATTGNILADFLLRDMTFGFSEFSSQRQVPQRWRDFEFYVSDSWKATPRVSVDYGLRYSYFANPYAADNRIMSFDPAAFNPALGADPCNGLLHPPGTSFCGEAGFQGGADGPNRSLIPQDTNNFAPRLGVAWDLTGKAKSVIRGGVGLFYLRERLSPGLNIGGNPPFVINTVGIRKLDTTEPPCEGCISNTNGVPGAGREQRAATPNSWQWNVSLQHEIARNTTVEVGYVGSRGRDLLKTHDANQVLSGDIDGNGVNDRLEYARLGPLVAASVRPFGVFGDSRITLWDHSGRSQYHSLQTQIVSRFGVSQFQASYTWSRTRSNEPMDNSDGNLSREMSTLDIQNIDGDYGLARINRPHVFNASMVLMLPRLEDRSAGVRHLLGDWEISTIVSAASGLSLSVYTGPIPTLPGGVSGTGYVDNQRPNRVPGVSCSPSGGPPEQIINPEAFTLTGMQLGVPGNAQRGACPGPNLLQTDLAFYKNLRFNDRLRFQFRFEIFNLFNRNNFLGTGGSGVNVAINPTSVTFDTGDPTTATTITGFTAASSFGQAVATRDPRQMQIGFKVIF